MVKKGPRQTIFICASIIEGDLVTEVISSASTSDASQKFLEKHSHLPLNILGPFYKKRSHIINNVKVLKFTNQNKKAIYNDWFVTAFLLKEPVNYAYLVFIKRVDDKKMPLPKGAVTVPISDLRFI